jgi:vacuolar-type H+-ATPase subunit I/STV1
MEFQRFVENAGGPGLTPPQSEEEDEDDDSSTNFLSITSSEDNDDEEELRSPIMISPPKLEEELTAPVQDLLDKLNTIAGRLNACESEVSEFESQKKSLHAKWNDQKRSLINSIGLLHIEKTKPVFDAYEKQQAAQNAVNETAALFMMCTVECTEMKEVLGTAQDNRSTESELGRLLEMSIESQTKRDNLEQLNLQRMSEFKAAQTELVEARKAVGLRCIEKAWPWFEAYTTHKNEYERIFNIIAKLRAEIKSLRENYRICMSQLETISEKVHHIRNNNPDNSAY